LIRRDLFGGIPFAYQSAVKAIVNVIDSMAETVDRVIPAVTFGIFSIAESLLLYGLFRVFWH
jgi:hypothetical protein